MSDFDIYAHQESPPPGPSPGLARWLERLRDGWHPNRRIQGMGWEEKCEFFRVYAWEYFNVLSPRLSKFDVRANAPYLKINPRG